MKKRKKIDERKKEIFYIISQIITEKGLSEVSTVEVAKRLGVSQPAIYKYFKNKDEMIIYYIDQLKKQLEEIIKKAEKEKNTQEKIKTLLKEHFSLLEKTKILPRVVFSDVIYTGKEKKNRLRDVIFFYMESIKRIVQEGIKKGEIKNIDPEFGVRIIIGSILSTTLKWMLQDMKYSIKDEVELIMENLKNSIFR